MTFSHENLLSPQEILADALVAVNDEQMKLFRLGWYMRQVRTATERLNFQAPFNETFFDIPLTDNLIIPMPKGAWDIKNLFLWNGENCVIERSVRVQKKVNTHTLGKGMGYTANKKTGQNDYFYATGVNDASVYWYSEHNGAIYLSDACASFQNIRIICNGMPTDISDIKFIPPFCREAVVGYVVERAFFSLKSRDLQYRALWMDAKQDLYSEPSRFEQSKWDFAISKLKQIDKKYMNDLADYLSKMNY